MTRKERYDQILADHYAGDKTAAARAYAEAEGLAVHILNKRGFVSRGERAGITFEDFLQEAFFAVVTALDTYRPGGASSLPSWIGWQLRGQFTRVLRRANGRTFMCRQDEPPALTRVVSANAPTGGPDSRSLLEELSAAEDVEARVVARDALRDMRERAEQAADNIEDERRRACAYAVIADRLFAPDPQTLLNIGQAYGYSRESVRNIETHIRERMT